jgi:hypothetical protein
VLTADLRVKVSGASSAADGKTFSETVAVRNAGPATATAIAIRMSTPGALTVKRAGGGSAGGGALHWSAAALAAGRTIRHRVTFKVGGHAHKRVSIRVSATSSGVADSDPSTNKAKTGVQLHPVHHRRKKHHRPKHHHPGG